MLSIMTVTVFQRPVYGGNVSTALALWGRCPDETRKELYRDESGVWSTKRAELEESLEFLLPCVRAAWYIHVALAHLGTQKMDA